MLQRWLLSVSVILLLNACATLAPQRVLPEVKITSIDLTNVELTEAIFEVGLKIVNNDQRDLTVNGMSYNLSLNGHKVVQGVSRGKFTVPAFSEHRLKVTASTSLFQGVGLIKNLMSQQSDAPVDYQMKTRLGVESLFESTLEVTSEGRIDLAKTY